VPFSFLVKKKAAKTEKLADKSDALPNRPPIHIQLALFLLVNHTSAV
jgi:hypothetical protein